MGYVFEFKDARNYSQWADKKRNRLTVELESRLMIDLLKPASGESVLDIGCGNGQSILPLLDKGLDVTGIDPSPYMLDYCHQNVGRKAELYRGMAEALPFDDNSFNHACFLTTLEFVNDPRRAIEEACRVAKDRIFIGFLNRYAIKGIQRRVWGIFTSTIYNRAQFFSVWELKRLVQQVAGPVPVSWRTVCQLPQQGGRIARSIEQSQLVQRCPFGAFAGMVVTLVPRFRTRPLAIPYRPKATHTVLTG